MTTPLYKTRFAYKGVFLIFSLINEECPDTFRHRGYYEKIYLYVLLIKLTLTALLRCF